LAMNRDTQAGKALGATLLVLGGLALLALAVCAYFVFGPGPTEFAAGERVTLLAYHAGDPTGVPAKLRSASLVVRGEYLARAADCLVCHTAEDGTPFVGGRAFILPFGTLYSTNITPDSDTGIGRYSDRDFLNTLHSGRGPGGRRLYPAMPFTSYTYMSDDDALAIKAYLFSLTPISALTPPDTLIFPFNQRALMSFWSALFNRDRRYEPNTERTIEWNRGAYLTEALGHCGECHTPRNVFFAVDNRRKFAGTEVSGWRAYNITPDAAAGIGAWRDAELFTYLAKGHAPGRGIAAGPMGAVVDESMKYLDPADLRAMITYLRSVNKETTPDLAAPKQAPAAASQPLELAANLDSRGEIIYAGACAGCHGWTGISPVTPLASLIGTRAVNDPTAINVAQVIIHGAQRDSNDLTTRMPALGETYTDAEVASVANYVTSRYGARSSTLTAKRVAKLREQD
jgi:mono/diheme cytochrome c family protein